MIHSPTPSAALFLCLLLLTGCNGGGEKPTTAGGAGAPPELPQAAPDSAEGIMDAAAEKWGGRRAMLAETGFHIRGDLLNFIGGGEQTQAGKVEVWMRYDPPQSRSREYIARVDPLTGEETASSESLQIINGDQAWVTNPVSRRELTSMDTLAEKARSAPTPRKVLLHREHHLTLALDGKKPIPELNGLEAWVILARDPSGNQWWVYVDMDRNLRKITYKDERSWISPVFESFREGDVGGLSRCEKATYYSDGQRVKSFHWKEREASPSLPDSLFSPPE